MTLIGIEFQEAPEGIERFAREIRQNSEKPVAQILFKVRVYTPEKNVLIIDKRFLGGQAVNMVFGIMMVLALLPVFFWGVMIPFYLVYGLAFLWALLNTAKFNYLMFRLMIKRMGYQGKTKML